MTTPETTTAPEVHKPALFNPENYEVVDYFDKHVPEPPMTGGVGAMEAYREIVQMWQAQRKQLFGDRTNLYCDHCGQVNVMMVVAVDYTPTGERKCFGWQCAQKIGMSLSNYKRERIETARKAQFARLETIKKKEVFTAQYPEIIEFIENTDNWNGGNEFIPSMHYYFQNNGELTEAQISGVRKFMEGKKRYEARKAEEALALASAPPAPEGRTTVDGVILSTRLEPSHFGDQFKMLVKLSDGNKAWGTVPHSVAMKEVTFIGKTIRFTATFTRSQDDQHFSYFKRPTKAEIMKVEEA